MSSVLTIALLEDAAPVQVNNLGMIRAVSAVRVSLLRTPRIRSGGRTQAASRSGLCRELSGKDHPWRWFGSLEKGIDERRHGGSLEKTIGAPRNAITMMIGASQNFFRSRMNSQRS